MPVVASTNLFVAAQACLDEAVPLRKVERTLATADAFAAGRLDLDAAPPPDPIGEPGRPEHARISRASEAADALTESPEPASPESAPGR